MKYEDCKQCGQRVATIALSCNILFAVLKFIVGICTGSKGCIADSLHSAVNIVTAVVIIMSQNFGKKESNADYNYGYGKIEFISAGFATLLVIIAAICLVLISIKHLFSSQALVSPHFSALLMAVSSIIGNEMLFRYMSCVGTQLNSQAIMASAQAARENCFSSIVVLIGLTGAQLGFIKLDSIAAIIVVSFIIKIGSEILIKSVKGLMDFSVNDSYAEEIKTIAAGIEGVISISDLKTRNVGQKIWVDLDICIDPANSIKDANNIASRVKKSLLSQMIDLERVIVSCSPIAVKGNQ